MTSLTNNITAQTLNRTEMKWIFLLMVGCFTAESFNRTYRNKVEIKVIDNAGEYPFLRFFSFTKLLMLTK